MSAFSKILERLGFGKKDDKPETKAPSSSGSKPKTPSFNRTPSEKAAATAGSYRPANTGKDMPMVDVVTKLEGMAKSNPEKLDWKVSIVDLLKLLDLDSSREARNELATELGIPADLMEDSAKMNMWLHKTVLQKIADNGGNVPRELLD